jgi:ribosomal-protein-alanine N-acetyltransferase
MTAGRRPEPGEPTVRPATVGDLDELAALEAASFPEGPWSRQQLADGLAAAGALWLVGAPSEPEEPLLGYAAFQRAADEAELLRVAVAPAKRRRGLGAALVDAGLERLRAAGARACFLEVDPGNRPALVLYDRLGFRPVGRRPGYYRHRDALLMRLHLGSADRRGTGML